VPLAVAVVGVGAFYLLLALPSFGLFGPCAAVVQRDEPRLSRPFVLAALWTVAELARGRGVGQPWCLLGTTQHANIGLIQIAAVTGVYGISFLLALVSAAVAEALRLGINRNHRAAMQMLAAPALVVAVCWSGGTLYAWGAPLGGFGGRRIAIVQTNVEPSYRWTAAYTEKQIRAHVDATARVDAKSRPALIVWPENAVPRYLDREPLLADDLATLANHHGADLLFGSPRFDEGRVYNSVRLITANGRDGGHYDKQDLVPFAEERPLSHWQRPVDDDDSPSEFTRGASVGLLKSFVTLGVTVCHEIVYPELVHRAVRGGAELLVNVSNDGWLDGRFVIAGRQNFAMAVFRAVESHRYLVRAAMTGISGVVDPYGRIVASLPPGESGTLTAAVAGRRTMTPYVCFGDWFAVACGILSLAPLLSARRQPITREISSLVPGPAPFPAIGR
jgi:apolipoprotein N-acyltransferase